MLSMLCYAMYAMEAYRSDSGVALPEGVQVRVVRLALVAHLLLRDHLPQKENQPSPAQPISDRSDAGLILTYSNLTWYSFFQTCSGLLRMVSLESRNCWQQTKQTVNSLSGGTNCRNWVRLAGRSSSQVTANTSRKHCSTQISISFLPHGDKRTNGTPSDMTDLPYPTVPYPSLAWPYQLLVLRQMSWPMLMFM